MQTVLMWGRLRLNRTASFETCSANSLVGTRIKAKGPLNFLESLASRLRAGSKKAAVFPFRFEPSRKYRIRLELLGSLVVEYEWLNQPTRIQQQAIPKALGGCDIFGSAQTGTGKTAAFLLPALSLLAQEDSKKFKGPFALILVPTRELAEQVTKEAVRFNATSPTSKPSASTAGCPIESKTDSSPDPTTSWFHPGPLDRPLPEGKIKLSEVKYFVLDEADRMLDMGFINDVERIAEQTSKTRQTLLFSATLNHRIRKISEKLQNNPFEIVIEPDHTLEGKIDQHLYYVDNMEHKLRLLNSICEDPELKQAIVFTSTKIQADRLSHTLRDKGYNSASLHGDINQRHRNQTLKAALG